MEEEVQLCSSNQKLNLKEENENLLRIMFKREFRGQDLLLSGKINLFLN